MRINKLVEIIIVFAACMFTLQAGAVTQCVVPKDLPQPKPVRIDWKNDQARADSYAFVLSWSPEFCHRAGDGRKSEFQCRINSFGFVVHGLWPQTSGSKNKFGHPRHCGGEQPLRKDLILKYLCIVPGADLMQEQWQKHGSCSFGTPEEYLGKINELYRKVLSPDIVSLVRNRGMLTAGEIADAFVQRNMQNGMKKENVVIRVAKDNYLREILICLDRQYRYTACSMRGTPSGQTVRVRLQTEK